MKTIKGLAVAAAAIAMVVGTSAFAESRHREGTNNSGGGRISREGARGGEVRMGAASRQSQPRSADVQSSRGAQSGRITREAQPTDRGQPRQYGAQPGTTETYRDRGSRQPYGDRNQQYRDRSRDQQNVDRNQYRDRSRDQQNVDRNQQQYRDRSREQQYRDRNQQQYRDRGRADNGRYGRNDRGSYDRNRGYGNRTYGNYGRSGSHSSMLREGRVNRILHERGGYRVWLGGFGYPFWIPEARWSRFPLRVGVSIRLGGWWDPLGYYNVYDVGPLGYYNTAGDIHGVVESVDYGRGTAVIRDDISRSFVTVLLRGNDYRMRDLRPGDYVDLSGQWTRGGIFEAYQLEALRDGSYDAYGDGRY